MLHTVPAPAQSVTYILLTVIVQKGPACCYSGNIPPSRAPVTVLERAVLSLEKYRGQGLAAL